ncbi:alpha/beta fold hydrolase [Lentisalinibacter sediminis]|uniref:alpha/beta fold hydrolase n=1 Tax=Lentisalinibacter sediminis TaxID=2992237 RepID=UPI00386B61BD
MRRHLFDSPLGQVHFVDSGDPAARPLLLMHQVPRSVDEFAEVIPLLDEHLRVIAMDLPGYGCSDRPPSQPDIAQYAEVAVALLDHLGLPRAALGGHHTGAIVSIEAAAAWPERVSHLVLSGPVYMDEAARRELGAVFEQWHVQPDGSHLAEKWHRMAGWIDDPALTQRCVLDLFRAGETSEWGHFAVAEYPMEERLPRVKAPALVLSGVDDPFSQPHKNQVFAEVLPDCRLATIGSGIFMLNERPREWSESVLAFLG